MCLCLRETALHQATNSHSLVVCFVVLISIPSAFGPVYPWQHCIVADDWLLITSDLYQVQIQQLEVFVATRRLPPSLPSFILHFQPILVSSACACTSVCVCIFSLNHGVDSFTAALHLSSECTNGNILHPLFISCRSVGRVSEKTRPGLVVLIQTVMDLLSLLGGSSL